MSKLKKITITELPSGKTKIKTIGLSHIEILGHIEVSKHLILTEVVNKAKS